MPKLPQVVLLYMIFQQAVMVALSDHLPTSSAAEVCHLWPSWPSDVPLRFRTAQRRSSPVASVTVLVSAAGAAELYLLETPERFYRVTLTPSELTLGRAELGVPGARPVARSCLSAPAAERAAFRLLWVSITRGFIIVGVEGARPCAETSEEAAPRSTESPTTEDSTAMTLQELDEVTALTSEVTALTSEVTEVTERQETVPTTSSTPLRIPLVTWQDGLPYFVSTYGVRTPDGQGVWTVECQPSSGEGRMIISSDQVSDSRPSVQLRWGIADDQFSSGERQQAISSAQVGDSRPSVQLR